MYFEEIWLKVNGSFTVTPRPTPILAASVVPDFPIYNEIP